MSRKYAFMAMALLLGALSSCEFTLSDPEKAVLAAESPWRTEKMKAAAKERMDKLKTDSRARAALRKLDAEIPVTDEEIACEKDLLDPKMALCYKHENKGDCEESKLCFWDHTRTKRDAAGLLVPNESCWPARQDECIAIDIGCCPGEKRRAVNKKSLPNLTKLRKDECEDKLLKENPRLCRGRSFYHYSSNERPQCRNKVCSLY